MGLLGFYLDFKIGPKRRCCEAKFGFGLLIFELGFKGMDEFGFKIDFGLNVGW